MGWARATLLLCACGRIGFDPTSEDALGFCASQTAPYLLCSDFDEPTDGFVGWTEQFSDFGMLTLDEASHRSPPRSLQVATSTLDTLPAHIHVIADPVGTVGHVTLSFDVQVVESHSASEPVFMQLAWLGGGMEHAVEYVYREPPDPSYIQDSIRPQGQQQGTYEYYQLTPQAQPSQAWQRISIEVFTGTAARVITTLDGVTTLDSPIMGTTAGTLALYVGIVYLGPPAPPWRLRYDNVLLTDE